MSHLRRLFLVVALALVLAPLVASAPLFDPDEGLHAAIAQEMVQRGDYVTPTFRGEPFLDKPILFFWAEAASLRLFGHNAAAVRIPPLLFGLFGMVTVALLGRALVDESAGLIAGIAYGTMLLPMGVSEVAVHDIGLVPFMCLAAYCLVRVDLPPEGGNYRPHPVVSAFRRNFWLYAIAAGVALGLSILTKGLVGIVFTGIFAVCLIARRPSSWFRLALAVTVAVVVALVVASPWYIAMERAHPGYLYYYFVERHLQGYLTATQRHAGRPFWYYLPIVLGGALPWTGYLLGALRGARLRQGSPPSPRRGFGEASGGARPPGLVLWGWFTIGLVFLSIGESKLVTYALPLFPILALIVGEYLANAGSRPPAGARLPFEFRSFRLREEGAWFTLGFAIQAITMTLLPVAGLLVLEWKFGDVPSYLWIGPAVFGLLTIDAARRAAKATTVSGFMAGIGRMTLLTIVALMLVAPHAATWMTSRDLAATLNSAGTLPPRVWVIDERIGSLIFYLDPTLRAQATPDRVDAASFAEAVMQARVDPPDAVFAVRNSQLPRFNRMFPSQPVPDALAGTFTLFRAESLRTALGAR
jgi:4-amino-4-deoxy-L-arabinose transferase-like glycosyltransferase